MHKHKILTMAIMHEWTQKNNKFYSDPIPTRVLQRDMLQSPTSEYNKF